MVSQQQAVFNDARMNASTRRHHSERLEGQSLILGLIENRIYDGPFQMKQLGRKGCSFDELKIYRKVGQVTRSIRNAGSSGMNCIGSNVDFQVR
jgi:hypothetical protein